MSVSRTELGSQAPVLNLFICVYGHKFEMTFILKHVSHVIKYLKN